MGKLGKIWQLVIPAFILLSCSAHAQELSSSEHFKNNRDGTQTLLHHVPSLVTRGLAFKMGHADAHRNLDLRIMLPSKDPAGMASLLKALYNPQSPVYHQFLTHQQVVQQFGASSVESTPVLEHLRANGLSVYDQSDDGRMLSVSGPLAAVERAFKVSINNYKEINGKTYFAPDSDPTVPPKLAGKIDAIFGMDNMHRFHHHAHAKRISGALVGPVSAPAVNAPALTQAAMPTRIGGLSIANTTVATHVQKPSAFTGPFGTVAPSDILTAYNLNSVSSKGTGQTQALYELDGFVAGDITQFTSEFNISPVPTITVVPVSGGVTTPGDGILEVDLDIDLTMAMAPGLSRVLVYEADQNTDLNAWLDEWNKIYTDNLAKTVSCSWGLD